jgi:predicted O-methyltransferase YrrM
MKFTRVLNTQLPYLFGGEIDYLEELSDYLEDNASVVFLGFGPGLMALALYEAAGYNKFNAYAIDIRNFTGIEHLKCLPFEKSIQTYVGTTHDLSSTLTDLYDAIFVDANHSYESVKDDIECWAGKVKPDGFLFFHDYIPQPGDLPTNGVKRAVDEWDQKGFVFIKQVGSSVIYRRL